MSTDESSRRNENPCCNSMVWTIKGKRGSRKASTIHVKPKITVPDPHHHSSSFSYAEDVTAESLLLLAKAAGTDRHGEDQNTEAGLNRKENRRLKQEEKSSTKRIYCRACDIFLSSAQALGGHKRGKMHRYHEAKMKQQSASDDYVDDVTDDEHEDEDNNKQQKTRLISEMNFDQNLPEPLSYKQKGN